jgi:hypothetical protein
MQRIGRNHSTVQCMMIRKLHIPPNLVVEPRRSS